MIKQIIAFKILQRFHYKIVYIILQLAFTVLWLKPGHHLF